MRETILRILEIICFATTGGFLILINDWEKATFCLVFTLYVNTIAKETKEVENKQKGGKIRKW